MTLVWADSFQQYSATTDMGMAYQVAAAGSMNRTANVWGGVAVLGNTAPGIGLLLRSVTPRDTYILGVRMKQTIGLVAKQAILMVLEAAIGVHVTMTLSAAGQVEVYRGANTTLLGTTTLASAITVDSWHYYELKVKVHDSAGTIDVQVDGINALSLTGLDTQNGGTGLIDQAGIGRVTSTGTADNSFCDLYICDTQGSTNNSFLGDVRVQPIYPTSDSTVQFTPSTGASNAAMVDDSHASGYDGDSTYVEAIAGNVDLYNMADLTSHPATVFGVVAKAAAKKNDASTTSVKVGAKSGGSTNSGSSQALSTSYVIYANVMETDPATAAAWTEAGVNASLGRLEAA